MYSFEAPRVDVGDMVLVCPCAFGRAEIARRISRIVAVSEGCLKNDFHKIPLLIQSLSPNPKPRTLNRSGTAGLGYVL